MKEHLRRLLVSLLVKRIKEEHEATMAALYLEDLGYDDCDVCNANRRSRALA